MSEGKLTWRPGELSVTESGEWMPNLLILGGAIAAPCRGSPWMFGLRRAAYEAARTFSDIAGTFALACAGMLDHHIAVTPWHALAAWQQLAPKAQLVACHWKVGRKFHSCTGGRVLLEQRLFRRHLGTTPFNYYRRCQLLHAQELLRRTPLTVTEAALAAGFQWATHFSQACAREFGCTPIQQRQVPKWRQVCRNDR